MSSSIDLISLLHADVGVYSSLSFSSSLVFLSRARAFLMLEDVDALISFPSRRYYYRYDCLSFASVCVKASFMS